MYTLTLFKTKTTDFPTLFKTEFWFFIPSCLRHLNCKTIINKNFAVVYFVEHTHRLFIIQGKIPCFRQKLRKSIPWLRQKTIKSIPCLKQKSRKTYPGWLKVPIKPLWGSTLLPWGAVKHVYPKRSTKMIDATEKPKIPLKFAKYTARYNEFRYKVVHVSLLSRVVSELIYSVIWPFNGCYWNWLALSIIDSQGWELQRSSPTDQPKEHGHKFTPKTPITSILQLYPRG